MFDGKKVFVTGGTGSWGHELVHQLLEKYDPAQVVIYSRGEHKQVEMRQEFGNSPKLKFVIGDVRDANILNLAMKGMDYVFHLAALKHVPVCEENCWEAVLTNVYGTQNVIEAAMANGVKKVIDISTDKAVDPFNHYGVTKACGEKLVINANRNYRSETKFVCIRGGNVMGTNGSVLPLFKKQLKENNEITLTDPEMTRYLMSTREAIGLVFDAVINSVGGEIFVMRMPATTLDNIATVMTELFGNEQTKRVNIGTRPGEKKHEVLVSRNEAPRTKIYNDRYFVITPFFQSTEIAAKYDFLPAINEEEFTSQNARQLSNEEFISILRKEPWLWEGDNLSPSQVPHQTTIGLTGASGFIGQKLQEVFEDDPTVTVIPFLGDLLKPNDIEEYFEKNPQIDTVIHLAGVLGGGEEEMMRVNVTGTKNLLAKMAQYNIQKIVFTSTGAIYHGSTPDPVSEDEMPHPANMYGMSKLLAEEAIKNYAESAGIKYVILRFPNVYGSGSDHGVIANFAKDIKEKGGITVNGDGSQSRHFLHVGDACTALKKAVFYQENEIFNIAPDHPYTLLEVIDLLKQKRDFEIDFQPANNTLLHLVLNNRKAKEKLNWTARQNELKVESE